MAQPFNLVAQLQIQGPNNLNQVVRRIQSSLNSVSANVNITMGRNTITNLSAANAQLTQMSANLAAVTANANNAAAAIQNMVNALQSAKSSNTNINVNLANVSKAAKTAANDMEEFGRISALAVRRFAAFSIPAGFLVGAVTGMKQMIQSAIEYDRQMNRLQQVTMASKETISSISSEIGRLSTNLGVSSKALSEVSVVLASAGYSASQVKDALDVLAQTQLASQFDDIKTTTDGAIAVMQQFKVEASDLGRIFGEMTNVARGFAVESRDIVTAIQHAGGAFHAAGGNLEELMAMFTAVRSTTRESAESIATGLRTIFTRIERPRTIEFLRQLGVELQDVNGMFVGPYEAIKRLSAAMKTLDTRDVRYSAVVEELGGYRQVSKVIPLLQEFGTAQKALGVAQAGSNALAQEAAISQDALATKLTKVKEEWLKLGREFVDSKGFKILSESALGFATALTQVLRALQPVIPLLTAMGSLMAVKAIGSMAVGFGKGMHFAQGGMVPGSGDGDTVPAKLTAGEFVLRKSAVRAIGPDNLHAMNQGYAGGGLVRKYANGSPGGVTKQTWRDFSPNVKEGRILLARAKAANQQSSINESISSGSTLEPSLNVVNWGKIPKYDLERVKFYSVNPKYVDYAYHNTSGGLASAINNSSAQIQAEVMQSAGINLPFKPITPSIIEGSNAMRTSFGYVTEKITNALQSGAAGFTGGKGGNAPGDFVRGVSDYTKYLLLEKQMHEFNVGSPTEIKAVLDIMHDHVRKGKLDATLKELGLSNKEMSTAYKHVERKANGGFIRFAKGGLNSPAHVFDFDETLGSTNLGPTPGPDWFDMDRVRNAEPLRHLSLAKKAAERQREMYILTARSSHSRKPIQDFLAKQGINMPEANIFTVGDMKTDVREPGARPGTTRKAGTALKKKMILEQLAAQHGRVSFYDDDEKNAAIAAQVEGVRSHLVHKASGGSSTDTVPALLTPGEFVFNKNAVNKIGVSNLHAMNKYAAGGQVGATPNVGTGAGMAMMTSGFATAGLQGWLGAESAAGKFAGALNGLIMTVEGTRMAMGMLQSTIGIQAKPIGGVGFVQKGDWGNLNVANSASTLARRGAMENDWKQAGVSNTVINSRLARFDRTAQGMQTGARWRAGATIGGAIGVGALSAGATYLGSMYEGYAGEQEKQFGLGQFGGAGAYAQNKDTANKLSSTGEWAATGAGIGAMFGPIGLAVGGTVGALAGLTKAFIQSDSVIKEANQKFIAEKFAYYERIGTEAAARVLSGKSYNEAGDIATTKTAIDTQMKAISEMTDASKQQASMASLANQMGRYDEFKTRGVAASSTLGQFKDYQGGLGTTLIEAMAKTQHTGTLQIEQGIQREIEARVKAEDSLIKAAFAIEQFTATLNVMRQFGAALENLNEQLAKTTQTISGETSISKGQYMTMGPMASTTLAQATNPDANINRFELRQSLQNLFGGQGLIGNQMIMKTESITDISRRLPEILRKALTSGHDISTYVGSKLGNDEYSQMIMAQLGRMIGSRAEGEVATGHDIREDANKVAHGLTGSFLQDWMKAIADTEKQLIDSAHHLSNATKQYVDVQMESTQLEVQAAQTRAQQINTSAQQRLSGTGLTLGLEQMQKPFYAGVAAMTRNTGAVGSTDVGVIATNLHLVNEKIRALKPGLQSFNQKDYAKADKSYGELQPVQARLVAALKMFADKTDLASAALNKLQEETARRETKGNFLTSYVFGDIENKLKMQYGMMGVAALTAYPEGERVMPEYMKEGAAQIYSQFKNVPLPVFGMGKDPNTGAMVMRTGEMAQREVTASHFDRYKLSTQEQEAYTKTTGQKADSWGDIIRQQVNEQDTLEKRHMADLEAANATQNAAQEALLTANNRSMEIIFDNLIEALKKFTDSQETALNTKATEGINQRIKGFAEEHEMGLGALRGAKRTQTFLQSQNIMFSGTDDEQMNKSVAFARKFTKPENKDELARLRKLASSNEDIYGTDAEQAGLATGWDSDNITQSQMKRDTTRFLLSKIGEEGMKQLPNHGDDLIQKAVEEAVGVLQKAGDAGGSTNAVSTMQSSLSRGIDRNIKDRYKVLAGDSLGPLGGRKLQNFNVDDNLEKLSVASIGLAADFNASNVKKSLQLLSTSIANAATGIGALPKEIQKSLREQLSAQLRSNNAIGGVSVPGIPTTLLPTATVPTVVPEPKANGGSIWRPRGTDTVPAMLTPGEFVVRREQAAKHRSLLEAINGGVQYAAHGGVMYLAGGTIGSMPLPDPYMPPKHMTPDEIELMKRGALHASAIKTKGATYDVPTAAAMAATDEASGITKGGLTVGSPLMERAITKKMAEDKMQKDFEEGQMIGMLNADAAPVNPRQAALQKRREQLDAQRKQRADAYYQRTHHGQSRPEPRPIDKFAGLAHDRSSAARPAAAVWRQGEAHRAEDDSSLRDAHGNFLDINDKIAHARSRGSESMAQFYEKQRDEKEAKRASLEAARNDKIKNDIWGAIPPPVTDEDVNMPKGNRLVKGHAVPRRAAGIYKDGEIWNAPKKATAGITVGGTRYPNYAAYKAAVAAGTAEPIGSAAATEATSQHTTDEAALQRSFALPGGNKYTRTVGQEAGPGYRDEDTGWWMHSRNEATDTHPGVIFEGGHYRAAPEPNITGKYKDAHNQEHTYTGPSSPALRTYGAINQERANREASNAANRAWYMKEEEKSFGHQQYLKAVARKKLAAKANAPMSDATTLAFVKLAQDNTPAREVGGIGDSSTVPSKGFATGGYVDNVPAYLSKGEFVMSASATGRIGANNLARMNSGGPVGYYADGGNVGAGGEAVVSGAAATAMQALATALTTAAPAMQAAIDPLKAVMEKATASFTTSTSAMTEASNIFKTTFTAFTQAVAGVPKTIEVKVNNIAELAQQTSQLNGVLGKFNAGLTNTVSSLNSVVSNIASATATISGLVGTLKDKMEVTVSVTHDVHVDVSGSVMSATDNAAIAQIAKDAVGPMLDQLRSRLENMGPGIA